MLNPSQALPGMSQRLVASRVMAPSPKPRGCLFAQDPTPDTRAATRPGVPGPDGSHDAAPAEHAGDAEGLRLSDPCVHSPTGPPGCSLGGHICPSSFGGSAPADRPLMQTSSSWQLLQGSGNQPRLSARSQKVP